MEVSLQQNFYAKAAFLVIDSRIKTKPSRNANGVRRPNKWFQFETDEIDDFKEELKIWKTCGSFDNRPPPMLIEVYLDTSRLNESQSLVIVDENGKRWDVLEQLNSSDSFSDSRPGSPSRNEVILERWRVELKTTGAAPTDDFGPTLPTIYKKAIVFIRSLFVTSRLLPAWKFVSQGPAKNSHPALIPKVRIRTSEPERSRFDRLRHPIDGKYPVTDYVFGDLEVPVGRLSTCVTYRNDCNFRIDDSEALLSSRFMGVDENFFKPSLPQQSHRSRVSATEVGSLRDDRPRPNPADMHQTYGSLSTFHGNNPLGTSPISALKAVRAPGSDTSSPPGSLPSHTGLGGPNSLPTGRHTISRPSIRTFEGSSRRPSVSFQPFKAGSLSGSPVPRHIEAESPASPSSFSRTAGIPSLQQPRNRTSLTAGMPASLRGPPSSSDATVAGSPRPASSSRYSSSFTHRRSRPSFGGTSRPGDDEQGSSGRQSLASSVVQPGSGLLAEPTGTSSGSLQNEDDNISEFLKVLDSKKVLKSFEPSKRGESATNRTVAQLSRFHMMKDSNNVLTDSMSSSVQMQRSSSSSSRQLASVPGMVAPASMSTSSSPGKPLSPHTPHTPAIPSRLSENSVVDYTGQGRVSSRQGRTPESAASGPSRQNTITQDGTTAIDIPLSPRLGSYQRRSSSAAQQNRASGEDDDTGLAFAHRSISLGADDREPPSKSTLLGRRLMEGESVTREGVPATGTGTAETSEMMQPPSLTEDNPPEGLIPVAPSSSPFGRRRYTGMGANHRQTPPQSSRGSFTGSAPRLARGDDESVSGEPLVFDLSEMDAQGRRSIEEGRPGSTNTTLAGRSDRDGRYDSQVAPKRNWED
ncbi:autophagy-related protein 13-domain-containing protein [Mariannaea sp. PMI_226]|nr:autophagy-related protein 13-domain-containing protein [Mariannaea sp. PMI_226]